MNGHEKAHFHKHYAMLTEKPDIVEIERQCAQWEKDCIEEEKKRKLEQEIKWKKLNDKWKIEHNLTRRRMIRAHKKLQKNPTGETHLFYYSPCSQCGKHYYNDKWYKLLDELHNIDHRHMTHERNCLICNDLTQEPNTCAQSKPAHLAWFHCGRC
jgi:hypothetical protein